MLSVLFTDILFAELTQSSFLSPFGQSGAFKSHQCQQLLTRPLKILFAGFQPNKKKSRKGPSGITGGGAENFFCTTQLYALFVQKAC